ncbi:MAG: alpha-glucan family phosphorylase [Nitrospiraceae bacterium]|nr:alpha-glucan family phosphorylase [Nitrospiraceae bacterium]
MDDIRPEFPNIPGRISGLGRLAYNLWWSWHPAARMLFKSLHRTAWKESSHNPVKLLKELPPEILENAARDQEYLRHYDVVISRFQKEIGARGGWFPENIRSECPLPIAYFSAEYGLHHSLPFYAGGLGFLAGDYLKECSDLGVPLVAVGFMYPDGYMRQRIRADGWQENIDEPIDRDSALITRVLDDKGQHLVVRVPFIEPPIHVSVWKVYVARVPLYLLDTDIEQNSPWNRGISAHLYIGDIEQRLRQEIVLGIGGSEVLNVLGIRHSVLHLNEGHPAFALLERIRERIAGGTSYETAVEAVKATSVFTTHTPVPAGHDVFPFYLMDKYFGNYYQMLGLTRDAFFRLGVHPEDPNAGFNMTAFALRMTDYRNGVSRRHGEVARRMWHSLWPDRAEEDVPIDAITNGIHVPTWIEPKVELLLNRYLDPGWLEDHDDPVIWEMIDDIPDRKLWEVHYWLKMKLINFIRNRSRIRWVEDSVNPVNIVAGGTLLDPSALTIGFARRFAEYKRADLIFSNLERLKRLLNNTWQPLQIIFAGKAHPADDNGKRILQRVFQFAQDHSLGGRIAFVENHEEQLAQYLVHGVDLWLNNPLPPMEASGTSGMKASLNGVPHLSVPDGWWPEGYNGKNGWIFGSGEGEGRDDADALYSVIEKEIIPLYYRADEEGVPVSWVKVMKEAMKSTAPMFSTRRMAKEYAMKFYQKALASQDGVSGVCRP